MMQGVPQNMEQILPLRDIKLPPEPGFWPLAPGWWVLIALGLVALTMAILWWLKHRRRKQRWQAIEAQLGQIEFAYKQHQDKQKLLSELSLFLRRFVRFESKNPVATTLAGSEWIDHLNGLDSASAFAPFAQSLTQGVYQANHEYDESALLSTMYRVLKTQVMRPGQPKSGGSHV